MEGSSNQYHDKEFFDDVLLHHLDQNKSQTEAYQLLCEIYGEQAALQRTEVSHTTERDMKFFRHLLLYYFDRKIHVSQTYQILKQIYGKQLPTLQMCRKWYKRYQSGDLSVEDKRKIKRKKYEDIDLETLLTANPRQTAAQIAKTFNADPSTVRKRLKRLGKKKEGGKWVQK